MMMTINAKEVAGNIFLKASFAMSSWLNWLPR